eukprot:TRINITY_DN11285_c0_g3_i2.p1 TRINITY_DN11285_c0_g3~~TRINITY_DN11285_c0_g3_i2.p1  ORF type:complete len:178 (-),score=51.63 TRINITY_DN11285_c0_g3_i2:164-622(-)
MATKSTDLESCSSSSSSSSSSSYSAHQHFSNLTAFTLSAPLSGASSYASSHPPILDHHLEAASFQLCSTEAAKTPRASSFPCIQAARPAEAFIFSVDNQEREEKEKDEEGDEVPLVRAAIVVALRELVEEELFLDYKLQSLSLPPWYSKCKI